MKSFEELKIGDLVKLDYTTGAKWNELWIETVFKVISKTLTHFQIQVVSNPVSSVYNNYIETRNKHELMFFKMATRYKKKDLF